MSTIVTIEIPVTSAKYTEVLDAIREHNGIPYMNEELAMAGKMNVTTWNLWSNVQIALIIEGDE